MQDGVVFDYLNPDIPEGLKLLDVPLARATSESMKGYGAVVHDPKKHEIEIVPWPLQGWRRLDAGTGNEGGTTEGVFACEWRGNELVGRNEAVGGHYVIGFRDLPETARSGVKLSGGRVLLWHCNYHPDGGQLFFPLDARPSFVPLALPGDDVRPERFVAFRFDGTRGLSIHANIRRERVFAVAGAQRFFDRQGAVHARASVDFPRGFGCLLEVPLA